MPQVRVRAKDDRVVNTQPRGGKRITNDPRGELVTLNSWVRRALEVHQDLEYVEDEPVKQPRKSEQPAATVDPATPQK